MLRCIVIIVSEVHFGTFWFIEIDFCYKVVFTFTAAYYTAPSIPFFYSSVSLFFSRIVLGSLLCLVYEYPSFFLFSLTAYFVPKYLYRAEVSVLLYIMIKWKCKRVSVYAVNLLYFIFYFCCLPHMVDMCMSLWVNRHSWYIYHIYHCWWLNCMCVCVRAH